MDSEDDEFAPIPAYNQRKGRKGKGKASGVIIKGKGPSKRKVKECRLRVVWVLPGCTRTPVDRERRMKEVWVRATADATEVQSRIREEWKWNSKQQIQYKYAQGKTLQPAKLGDVENADGWDCESVKALMGSGFLYISKESTVESSSSDSEEVGVINCCMASIRNGRTRIAGNVRTFIFCKN